MVQVRLLGPFVVETGRASVQAGLGSDGKRLASYLFTFPNRHHRREKLLDLFWPELETARARAGFSTALWKVKRLLGLERKSRAHVYSTPQDVLLDLSDISFVDAHQFRAATLNAFSTSSESSHCDSLAKATELYHGQFLEEYDDAWVLEQREGLQALYIRALANLMCLLAQKEKYEDAILCGKRLLASDATRETIHRAVMVLYVLNGQRAEAIRHYDRCERVLAEECDVRPMPDTRDLVELIRTDEIFRQLPSLAVTMFAVHLQTPFINPGP